MRTYECIHSHRIEAVQIPGSDPPSLCDDGKASEMIPAPMTALKASPVRVCRRV